MKCNPWVGGSIGRRGFPMLGTGKRGLSTYVKQLFSNNEQGFFYDPNDLSTLFQDAAGTVPVTGAGQPVGLILDKKNPALVGGEVDVDITNWLTSGGINKVNKNTFSNPSAATGLFYDGAAIDGLKIVELHYTVTGGTIQICDALGVRVRAESTQPSGVLKATFYPDRSSNPLGRIYLRTPTAGTTVVIDKLIVHTYTGNHAYQTTSASRPILRQNATTGANYLEFDGSDDFLQTNAINFTATDKASLFAGVRKLSDAFLGMLVELSFDATVNNGFYIATPSSAGAPAYRLATGSPSAHVLSTSTFPAPASNVLAASYDKSKSTALASTKLRVNGTQNALTVAIEGDSLGAFSNSPIYIGRRAGTSLPFNGHIYGLIGVGKLVSENEAVAIEKELAKRLGVTLNV